MHFAIRNDVHRVALTISRVIGIHTINAVIVVYHASRRCLYIYVCTYILILSRGSRDNQQLNARRDQTFCMYGVCLHGMML